MPTRVSPPAVARARRVAPVALAIMTFCMATPCGAAPTPAPTPHPKSTRHLGIDRLATRSRLPNRENRTVSAAACNRRTIAVNPPSNQLGPQGASASQTLVTVPLNGSVAAATRESEISEICAHVRQ